MSEPISTTITENQLSRTAPIWICALVVGIGIAVCSAVSNRGHRKELERVLQNTAVGDSAYFPLADKEKLKLTFVGDVLTVSNQTPDPMPESRMILSGETDGPKFRLYVPAERANSSEEVGGPSWYLKTGPGQFLRVTR